MSTTFEAELNALEAEQTEAPAKAQRVVPLWSAVAGLGLAAVLGTAGGFLASGLHPGPAGKAGVVGAQGIQGIQGEKGAKGDAGSAANVSGIGVCWESSMGYSGTVSYVSNVYLTSPTKKADGTMYCPSGTYISVLPQTDK